MLIGIFLGIPLALTVINIVNIFLKQPLRPRVFDTMTMIVGAVFSIILYSLFEKDYHEPIVRSSGGLQLHRYIASWQMPTILLFALVGISFFLFLEFYQNDLPPVISAVCLSGVYIGIALSIVFIIQTSNHFFESYVYSVPLSGIYAPLFPINYILCSVRLIRETAKIQVEKIIGNTYENRLMSKLQKILSHSVSWLIIPFILALPLLGVSILILILFGQRPDAVIKAFTETSDWTLSRQISPPPVSYQGHYLCTAALRGDERIVKPTRCGIRHGHKIIVNRQLCVANAFEQAIEEKLPRLHRLIRNFYDTHGYPLSKKITTAKRANAVYLLMKPLEWFFVLFLYTVDANPENRIAMQYTKK